MGERKLHLIVLAAPVVAALSLAACTRQEAKAPTPDEPTAETPVPPKQTTDAPPPDEPSEPPPPDEPTVLSPPPPPPPPPPPLPVCPGDPRCEGKVIRR